MQDLRSGWRWFKSRPGLGLFVLVTLSLGIAAATAVFTVVQAVVFRDLPFRDPQRLVWMWNARVERDRAPFSVADLDDYRAQNHVLERLAAFTNWTANLTGLGEAERLEGVRVVPEFFEVLGAEAAIGRVFRPGDDPADRVVVLTDRLWRRRFAGDPALVGRTILLSGVSYTVVAVLPPRFVFPFRDAELAVPLPLASDPRRGQRGAGFLRVVARLRRDTNVTAAKADLDAIGRRLQAQYPVDDGKKTGVNLFPLQSEIVGDSRQLLLTLFAAVGLLLVVACANVTNLLVVALSAREPELQIRIALGASRGRLVRQILTEIGALAIPGGALGVLLAAWLVRVLARWGAAVLPRLDHVSVDLPVLAFSAATIASVTVVCAVIPALVATRDLGLGARGDARTATGTAAQHRLRRVFVAAQIAASMVLLVAIGLTLRSFINLQRVDPGFSADGVVAVQLSLPPPRYASPGALSLFADTLQPRLAALPGVQRASAVSLLPLSGLLRTEDFWIIGRPDPPPDAVPQGHLRVATPGYFDTMNIAIVSGRDFSDDDRATTAGVAAISRTFADRFWSGVSPVGAHIRLGTGPAPLTIIGVVADVQQFSLDAPPTADIYVPLRQIAASDAPLVAGRMYWIVRSSDDPVRIADRVRREIHAIDSEIAASGARNLGQVLSDALGPRRFVVTLLGLFGQAALLLAAVGVYAVTAFAVARRTREIGIRVAFGATRANVLALVVGAELRAVAGGLAIGLCGGLAIARVLAGTLFQVDPFDPWTLLTAAGTLAAVAAIGCYLPARRASAVDPAVALRIS